MTASKRKSILKSETKPIPINKNLYSKAKEIANEIYDRPSAYKSGFIVKKYKELGGRYSGSRKKSPLKRWFNEEWKDINPHKTETSYPVYRPTKKISAETPLTADEIDYTDLLIKSKIKQKYKNTVILPPFKKKSKSPRNNSKSPGRKSKSPGRKTKSPRNKSKSPRNKSKSSRNKSKSPRNKSKTYTY